ncbi:methylmalonyl Co-A mutase-associated GTPase MeaB [Bacillus massiliigorillae]|uniref:methylmalonyl Co-A mutase-associated GTPase MeaB n=1 Tax=Bacillus massiliigorillae TaxID=1243664 RepID=UPI0003A5E5A1|nr:methylmalonyl Co-A mutase-associated GTPase MeaB [Bacillus massiliigorillae]
MKNNNEKHTKFVKKNRREINTDEILQGILAGNRAMLAKGITLIESNAQHHFESAQELLQKVLPYTNKSIRIGISGVPGAGKSTFIERFGTDLCNSDHKVAVLAIDPSSTITGGSILGDKTRMELLSGHENAFIRPSPSEGTLGGVHRKTRESMLLCEAAGFDVIIIETVGVGQSEAIVRGMTDFFMLLAITGAGDELQGMKKGIMELADAIVVNKADGDNKRNAMVTKEEYNRILHFLQPATQGWQTQAYACSSIEGDGIQEIWEVIQDFMKQGKQSGVFNERRRFQTKEWMNQSLSHQLHRVFFDNQQMRSLLPVLEQEVMNGDKTVSLAVMEAIQTFLYNLNK